MTKESLKELVTALTNLQGVKGSLVATSDGPLTGEGRSGFAPTTAKDVAKTVRRMTVASATVGVPLQELLINFGAGRMMIQPLNADATIVVLLERDSAIVSVRELLAAQLGTLRTGSATHQDQSEPTLGSDGSDEVDQILSGELGPVLHKIRSQFTTYVVRTGRSADEAETMMREQMREWLLCCNPSTYTFPLLIDGLGQLLNNAPTERSEFIEAVQSTIRPS